MRKKPWFRPAPLEGAGYRVLASEVAPLDEDPPSRLIHPALRIGAVLLLVAIAAGVVVQLAR